MLDLSTQPHHDGSPLYVDTDAPGLGGSVTLRLRVPRGFAVEQVFVRSTPDAEPHYDEASVLREDADAVWWSVSVRIVNPLTRYRWLLSGPDGAYRWLSGDGLHEHDVPDAYDFTLSAYAAPPAWAQDAIVYQIFPDRFARSAAADGRETPEWAIPATWDKRPAPTIPAVSAELYGGDLDGVIEHLDHIEDLGCNTIYLTPFFPAGSTHRYDSTTFDTVDPLLGGDEALVRLVQAAHARGMRVIGDLTTNHSGVGHAWFQSALADEASPERAFYYFREDGSYLGWYDVPSLPKFRFGPELRARLTDGPESVVGRWLAEPFKLDGWRIDVANMTGRHAADNDNLDVARSIRATMDAVAPEALLVAEHCHDASGDLSGEGWHGAMNYAGFLRPIWTWLRDPAYHRQFLGLPIETPRLPAESAFRAIRAFQGVSPWRSTATSWSLIDSHDTPRARTVMGAGAQCVAAGMLFTFPGAPMVFMGGELGGEGTHGEDARRGMPWDRPDAWDTATHESYRALARLRAAYPALRRGSLRWLAVGEEALAYVREDDDATLLCLAARGDGEPLRVRASAIGLADGEQAQNLYGGADPVTAVDGTLTLPAEGPQFQVWMAGARHG